MINNFDISSSGVNLTLIANKDSFISGQNFEDEIAEIKTGLYCYYYYLENGLKALTFNRTDIYKNAFNEWDKREFIETWNYWFDGSKVIEWDDLIRFLDDHSYHREFIEKLAALLPEEWTIRTARGYCQGDANEVICKTDTNDLKDYENIFYNAPCYIRLDIDEEEYYLDEHLSDIYEFDKDQVIQGFIDNYNGQHKDTIVKFLQDNLGDYLDYDC